MNLFGITFGRAPALPQSNPTLPLRIADLYSDSCCSALQTGLVLTLSGVEHGADDSLMGAHKALALLGLTDDLAGVVIALVGQTIAITAVGPFRRLTRDSAGACAKGPLAVNRMPRPLRYRLRVRERRSASAQLFRAYHNPICLLTRFCRCYDLAF